MADLTYEIGVNTTQATRALDNLNQRVSSIAQSFNGLRTAITSIAFGSLVQNALRYADAINDVADATGFAVDTVNRFSQAVQQSGGNVDGAQNAILRFSQTIGEAVDGSKSAQAAFGKIGIGLNDLAKLDDEQLFRKTIENISKIPDLAEQARLKTELFGKTLRSVNLQNVAGMMAGPQVGGAQTSAIIAAGQAQDNYTKIMGQFTNAIINVTEPLNNFVAQLKFTQKEVNGFVKSATDIGSFALILMSFIPIGRGMKLAGTAVREVTKSTGDLIKVAGNIPAIGRNFGILKTQLNQFPTLGGKITAVFAAMGIPITAIIQLVKDFPIRVGLLIGFLLDKLGILQPLLNAIVDAFKLLTDAVNLVSKAFNALTGLIITVIDLFQQLLTSVPIVSDVFNGLSQAVDFVGKSISASFEIAGKNIYNFMKPSLDWLGGQFTALEKKGEDFYKSLTPPELSPEQFAALDKAMADATFMSPGFDNLYGTAAKDKKDAEDKAAAIRTVVNAYSSERQSIANLSKEFDRFNKDLIDNINNQTRAAQMGTYFAQQQDAVNQVLKRSADDVQALRDRLANLSEDERIAGIGDALRQQIGIIQSRTQSYADGARAAVQALQAEQDAITITQNKLEDYLDAMSSKIDIDAMRAQLDLIGLTGDAYDRMAAKLTMEADLKQALNDIEADRQRLFLKSVDMSVAAFQAEMDILDQREQRARDTANALYNIELDRINRERALRNNAQAGIEDYFAQIAQSMEPYEMAQKKVGAIWGNMETTIDNFVKTGKLKMKDFALSVIQDLIAIELKALALQALKTIIGMFGIPMLAKGGPAQQGKPYIVGEKGPELFVPRTSGQVVPNDELAGMAAGKASSQPVTNNYYTIQAVDAKSVAQLFYENRKTMLGTVKMAERELSYRI